MRVRHLTQRGRSIGESKSSVKDEVMRLTLIRRELDTLGHRQLPKNGTVIIAAGGFISAAPGSAPAPPTRTAPTAERR